MQFGAQLWMRISQGLFFLPKISEVLSQSCPLMHPTDFCPSLPSSCLVSCSFSTIDHHIPVNCRHSHQTQKRGVLILKFPSDTCANPFVTPCFACTYTIKLGENQRVLWYLNQNRITLTVTMVKGVLKCSSGRIYLFNWTPWSKGTIKVQCIMKKISFIIAGI